MRNDAIAFDKYDCVILSLASKKQKAGAKSVRSVVILLITVCVCRGTSMLQIEVLVTES